MHIYAHVLQLHRSGREIRLWHAGLSMDGWDVALPREQGYEWRDTPAPNDQDMLVARASRPSEGEAKRQKTTSDSGTASSQQRWSIAASPMLSPRCVPARQRGPSSCPNLGCALGKSSI